MAEGKFVWVNYLVNAYNNTGQTERACEVLEQYVKNDSPDDTYTLIRLSYLYNKQGKPDKSITAAKRAIEVKPGEALAHNSLGLAYRMKKQYTEAENAFKKAIALDPDFAAYHANMGGLLYDKDDYAKAAEAYKKAVELQPSAINYLISLANTYRLTGEYDDAMSVVNKAIELQTFGGIGIHIAIESSYPIIKNVMETGPAKKADVQGGDKVIKVDAKSTKGWNLQQIVQSLRGASGTQVTLTIERKGVDKPLEKLITRETILDKTAATSFGLRSLIHRYKGEKEDSFMDAAKAHSLDSTSDWALVSLGTSYLDRGKYDESVELLSQVKGSRARILEATAYAKQRDFNKAIDIYSAIPEENLSPKNVPLWSDRAALLDTLTPFIASRMENAGRLKTQGRHKEALNELGDVLKIADDKTSKEICGSIYRIMSMDPRLSELPEEARKYALRGDVMTEEGKFEEAVKEYRKAVQSAPYIAKLYFNTAMIYGELKRHPQAIRNMKTYLLLAPEAPNARAAKDQIYKWEFMMEKEK
ncbi:MAG: tetratricopeptide repeat protein [Thermodesulfobacteriota bacterium]|nr:tetratricopeptide repeat protein [Thermodesulfobacteriota bacterium]